MRRVRIARRWPIALACGHWYLFAGWPPFVMYLDVATGEAITVVSRNPIRVVRETRRLVAQRARDRAWEVGCDDHITLPEAVEAWDRLAP